MTRPSLATVYRVLGALSLGFATVFGWLFYEFYWRWRNRFENGRYFHEPDMTVYHDSAVVWLIPLFASVSVALLFFYLARRRRKLIPPLQN